MTHFIKNGNMTRITDQASFDIRDHQRRRGRQRGLRVHGSEVRAAGLQGSDR